MPRRRIKTPRERLRPRGPGKSIVASVVLAVTLAIAAYKNYEASHRPAPPVAGTPAVASENSNWLLGNPSNAAAEPDNFLLIKPYFVGSYNNSKGTPNWVSWRLNKDDLGDSPRRDKFSTDVTLPLTFNRVSDKDYTNSGFDRGHLCPHGDRTKSKEMSYATFVMTNIMPQCHELNEKAWNMLELYCRDLARNQNARLYVTAGPAGVGAAGNNGYRESFANKTVTVPRECWKIIVIVPDDGTEDLSDITESTRVIAVVMPNTKQVGYEWAQFRVSPADVETLTGYRFFTALPPDIAAALRRKIDRTTIEKQEPPRW